MHLGRRSRIGCIVTNEFVVTHNTMQVIAQFLGGRRTRGTSPITRHRADVGYAYVGERDHASFAPRLTTLRLQSGANGHAKYETLA